MARRFGLARLLLAISLIVGAFGALVAISSLWRENERLRSEIVNNQKRLDDIESFISGRPFRFRTDGLKLAVDGQMLPERLASIGRRSYATNE